jgi:hypothetical protein
MSREHIVGGEHLVGSSGHHDYDELMELGGEPTRSRARRPDERRDHDRRDGRAAPRALPPHEEEDDDDRDTHDRSEPPHQEEHMQARHAPEAPAARRRRRLVEEEPTHERQFPIGFMFEGVQPGDAEDIEVKPQVYFRGERLAIPVSLARYFDIVDIKVGKDSQLAATGSMPGESFATNAVGVRMELDTAKPGIVITIRVQNVDTAAHDFKAVMYGAVLE